jgi:hypothetical protein
MDPDPATRFGSWRTGSKTQLQIKKIFDKLSPKTYIHFRPEIDSLQTTDDSRYMKKHVLRKPVSHLVMFSPPRPMRSPTMLSGTIIYKIHTHRQEKI